MNKFAAKKNETKQTETLTIHDIRHSTDSDKFIYT